MRDGATYRAARRNAEKAEKRGFLALSLPARKALKKAKRRMEAKAPPGGDAGRATLNREMEVE